MKTGTISARRWQVVAIAAQVAAVAACGVLGWQLTHPSTSGSALTIRRTAKPPILAPAVLPSLLPRVSPRTSAPLTRPGLEDLMARVNRDDVRLYRGQWATIQLVASATRSYLTNHVEPLLLAATRGGVR